MKILLTGVAGFIGSHLADGLVAANHEVVGVDNFDSFYARALKERNLARLLGASNFELFEADVRHADMIESRLVSLRWEPDVIVHLAAKAGVRPSIEKPVEYSDVNVVGTSAILQLAHRLGTRRFVFASSSSVYGNNKKTPFSEADEVVAPISPYAASKLAGEHLVHAHWHLNGGAAVCLRFFTVYGPRQRPDLAIHKFARLMLEGKAIPIFGDGKTQRDYTFIDDIVKGTTAAILFTKQRSRFEVINLGSNSPIQLLDLVGVLADRLGVTATLDFRDSQPGDVDRTFADLRKAQQLLGFRPATSIEDGLAMFADWMKKKVPE